MQRQDKINNYMSTREVVEYYRTHNPKIKVVKELAEKCDCSESAIENLLDEQGLDMRYYRKMKKINSDQKPAAKKSANKVKKEAPMLVPEDELPWTIPTNDKEVETTKPISKSKELPEDIVTVQKLKSNGYDAIQKMLEAETSLNDMRFYCAGVNDIIDMVLGGKIWG